MLLLYTDGGPDHRLTYVSVQIALLALFVELDLDFLCAVRTPPYNSWKNPAERVMSILNIALQGVGIARAKLKTTSGEEQLQKCKNMKAIRELAKSVPGLEQEILDSLEQPKTLVASLFSRLKLKDEPFSVFVAASEEEIESVWENVKLIDSSLKRSDTTKRLLEGKKPLQYFLASHCKVRHYMFSVKKCGEADCSVCKTPRLPSETFAKIHHLPDPVPSGEKYKDFERVYGTHTTEVYRPSLSTLGAKHHGMPFAPSAQYAKNVKVVIQCGECLKWRVLYCKHSLRKEQKEELEREIDVLEYTCGSTFADIECDDESVLTSVFVKANLTCNTPTEIPYYTAGNTPICYYCGSDRELQEEQQKYPFACHAKIRGMHLLQGIRGHPKSEFFCLLYIFCGFVLQSCCCVILFKRRLAMTYYKR